MILLNQMIEAKAEEKERILLHLPIYLMNSLEKIKSHHIIPIFLPGELLEKELIYMIFVKMINVLLMKKML